MKKILLVACFSLAVSIFSAPMTSYAGYHWVCGANNTNCWKKYDGVEYRGKQKEKATDDVLKEELLKAEREAAKLEGEALIEAANAATMEAAIGKLKSAALNNRVAELAQKTTGNNKKGIKNRGVWDYAGCYHWIDGWGNYWYRCR